MQKYMVLRFISGMFNISELMYALNQINNKETCINLHWNINILLFIVQLLF